MKIFGIIDDYGYYDKIPITSKDWFEQYEQGIDILFSSINLNLTPSKELRKQTDIIWLRKYLQIINRFIVRNENKGVSYSTKEIFSLFKLPCIRERFFCKYNIDIYDGLGKTDRKIEPRDECYLYGACNDTVYYNVINDGEKDVLRIYIEDVYNYDNYYFYIKENAILQPISSTVKDGYVYIYEEISPENIVVRNDTCFYSLTKSEEGCETTATGVYLSNGDYEIILDPLDTDISKISIEIDGVARVIDESSIIYHEGKILFKNAYKHNYIRLVGCPNILFEIGGGCNYNFSMSVAGDEVSILIAGGNTSPRTEDINITMNNTTFSNYSYDDRKISFNIDPSYIGQGFILRIANCIFGFGLYKEDDVIVIKEKPNINEEIFTRCVGMNKQTIKRTYILSLDSPIPNTWIPQEELLSTEENGCRESLIVKTYKCEDGEKYEKTMTVYKGYGDPTFPDPDWTNVEWVKIGESPECEKQGNYDDINAGYEDECDGCDKKTYEVKWVYNESIEMYEKERTLSNTIYNGCKEYFKVLKCLCAFEETPTHPEGEYILKTIEETWSKCPNDNEWQYVNETTTSQNFPIELLGEYILVPCDLDTLGVTYNMFSVFSSTPDFYYTTTKSSNDVVIFGKNETKNECDNIEYEWTLYDSEYNIMEQTNTSDFIYSVSQNGTYYLELSITCYFGGNPITMKRVEKINVDLLD